MDHDHVKLSPDACDELLAFVEDGGTPFDDAGDELQGQTDCPDGCSVEPDGFCVHGWLSAQETLIRSRA